MRIIQAQCQTGKTVDMHEWLRNAHKVSFVKARYYLLNVLGVNGRII
jgi:hypothetical protein